MSHDPPEPGGAKFRKSRTLKNWVTQKFFFCWNCKLLRLSFHLRPWSSKLDPPDPFWTPKTKKNTPKVHGSLQGNPPSGSPVDQTGSPTSIILVILQTRGFKGYPQKKLSYPTLSLTPPQLPKFSPNNYGPYGILIVNAEEKYFYFYYFYYFKFFEIFLY